jgi:hypothetical protein
MVSLDAAMAGDGEETVARAQFLRLRRFLTALHAVSAGQASY